MQGGRRAGSYPAGRAQAQFFRKAVSNKPDWVHLHACSPFVSVRLFEMAFARIFFKSQAQFQTTFFLT